MTRSEVFRILAGPLILLAAACTTPKIAEVSAEPAVPCNAVLVDAANYGDDLADHREEQMMLMRFASEQAMQAYVGQTRRIRMDAMRMDELLAQIVKRHGSTPEFKYQAAANMTPEGAAQRIAAATACADQYLK